MVEISQIPLLAYYFAFVLYSGGWGMVFLNNLFRLVALPGLALR